MSATRREFLKNTAVTAAAATLAPTGLIAQEREELNILCWEGYNTDDVLEPFRQLHPGMRVRAESGTSDPDMINKLRAGETRVWDLINVNQPWARGQLYPEGLIKELNQERFAPYFEKMLPEFQGPYDLSMSADGNALIGMVQRFGPFGFAVNTEVISRHLAEDEGYKLFLDPAMKGRFGVLTYDNWNIIHMCLAADLNPFVALSDGEVSRFKEVATQIFANAKLRTDDLVAMNTALINGEIDAYFTGGTYSVSPARYDGQTKVRGITPKTGPIDGKGGVVWVELTSLVNNPYPSVLAEDFLEYVQQPEVAKAVSFAEGTYNPVSQMGNPEVLALYGQEELEAVQWDSLQEDMARSADYDVVVSYEALSSAYNEARRG